MKPIYLKFRILLFTLALGLASVPFVNFLSEKWTEVKVDLPQVRSETPIFVMPKNHNFHIEVSVEALIQNRNLSLYDIGGNFSNCFDQGFKPLEFRKCEQKNLK